ncbi:hypothetical protein FK85_00200 [Halorubrum saccharovorum]|uniref:Uncharacterized protein n=1 Tax=Halorubrum saccharovorum TaxID=2248 RepID=A0A081EW01_9EURY|nr:hypothetical protein [Halorubrum saccharovorum]KDS91589.2 hypothetical protein FK85_00200 [Halorubrum saccharovorum]
MSALVNTLGMLAGAVWIGASIWFELIHPRRVHGVYVAGTFLIGSALILASSALLTPSLAESFAAVANVLFLFLGIAAWIWIERNADDAPAAEDLDGVRS